MKDKSMLLGIFSQGGDLTTTKVRLADEQQERVSQSPHPAFYVTIGECGDCACCVFPLLAEVKEKKNEC